ncbi:MAG: glycosyltransferase family 25 protein [Arenibacterium sp.]
MRSMVIHMSSSRARRDNAEKLLLDLPRAALIEAVDGRDPDQIAHMRCHPGTLYRPHYPFPLRPAEIGVFLSHRKCWKTLVDSGDDFALIAEDDLTVEPGQLATALDLIREHATPKMYVRMPVKDRERQGDVIAEQTGMRFILPRTIGLQCICQVVGRDAAKRLLRATEEIDRPVDTLLQMHWVTGQLIHAILPNGNKEVAQEIGGSTIQVKTSGKGKLKRELARAAYRTRIAMHPQRFDGKNAAKNLPGQD